MTREREFIDLVVDLMKKTKAKQVDWIVETRVNQNPLHPAGNRSFYAELGDRKFRIQKITPGRSQDYRHFARTHPFSSGRFKLIVEQSGSRIESPPLRVVDNLVSLIETQQGLQRVRRHSVTRF